METKQQLKSLAIYILNGMVMGALVSNPTTFWAIVLFVVGALLMQLNEKVVLGKL
jgi:hypothetical protein